LLLHGKKLTWILSNLTPPLNLSIMNHQRKKSCPSPLILNYLVHQELEKEEVGFRHIIWIRWWYYRT
jgi:hypothetical protein